MTVAVGLTLRKNSHVHVTYSFALPSLFLRFMLASKQGQQHQIPFDFCKANLHVERDTEAETKQSLCKDDASLMQAWSEDGTALVRRRCG